MSVEMKQKAGANVTPKDDALLYDFLIADSGVVEGCVVSAIGGTQMKITSGRGVILGRVFVIEAETIQATLPATTETQNGRLLVRINGTTQEIAMVTQAAASLPALQKEDINRGGTLYELELATYKISKTVITDLQVTAHTIEPHPKNTLLHVTKALQDAWNAVSYTHLRAHETRHDLVCRLLLEKKKNENRQDLVCRLLREKKKKNTVYDTHQSTCEWDHTECPSTVTG